MKAAIYARVSTTDQNCELQLKELREYAHRHGWEIAGEYVDIGWSGAKASRPELDKLMQDASKRKVDVVLVWKIDRFGRSLKDCLDNIYTLDDHEVCFIAVTQGIDTNQKNPASRFMLQVLGAAAEFERELNRERTLSGIKAAQAAGKVIGRPKRVFRRDAVVRLRDEEGLSWRAIGTRLGIPAMTALDSYRQSALSACTESVPAEMPDSAAKRRTKTDAAYLVQN